MKTRTGGQVHGSSFWRNGLAALAIAAVTGILFHGCFGNADRNNPLDPKSGKFQNTGAIAVQALTYYAPFTPLVGVRISLEPGGLSVQTDALGEAIIDQLDAGSYSLSATKDGYGNIVDSVTVQTGQTAQVRINLDALPTIKTNSIVSYHLSRWWPQNDLFLLNVSVEAQDADGMNDIALALCEIPGLGFVDTLQATQTLGLFSKSIRETQLPNNNIQDILGQEILIRIVDKAGFAMVSAPRYLARVIEQVPTTESPQGLEIVTTSQPLLSWRALTLPFAFTYGVELTRVDVGVNSLVWSISGIDNSLAAIEVPVTLTTGTYFWTIAVYDDFGNGSRSKEASFQIK